MASLTLTECDGFILRRARVTWRCEMPRKRDGETVRRWDHGEIPAGHQAYIAPGAQYVEDVNETAAYQSGPRYCGPCAVAAGLATEG